MKLPTGLLLLCVVLTVSIWAEETAPVKNEVPEVKRELVWPEIKDPQALIDFAKAEIRRVGEGDKKWGWPIRLNKQFAYLGPGDCYVRPEYLAIQLDTHPATGQALFVFPTSNSLDEKTKRSLGKTEETATPGIIRVLSPMPSDLWWSIYNGYEIAVVRWRNFRNLSRETNSWPKPLDFSFPDYPSDMAKQGVPGDVNIEFAVTKSGLTSDLLIQAPYPELESAVRKVAQCWRFEPGVDLETRLPAVTRMSLTVKFMIDED